MRNIPDDIHDGIESTARAGARAVVNYLNGSPSQTDRDSFLRARVGMSAIGSYVRLAATETNREALRMAAERAASSPQELPEAGE